MHSLHNYDLRLALQRGIPFADPNGYSPTIMATWPVGDIYGSAVVGGFIYVVAGYFPGIVRKVDRATGLPVLDIAVGNDPRGLTYDGTFLWCANYDSTATPPGNTVSKIDVATDTVVATVNVGSKPVWSEPDDTGSVWVACTGSLNASKIDCATNVVTTIPIGINAGAVAYDGRGYMFFGGAASTSLKRIRTSTGAVTTVVMPHAVYGLCSASGFVWATDFNTKVTSIDRLNLSMSTIILPHTPARRPSFDGKRVWVPCGSSGYTVVVDPETNAVVTSVHTGSTSDRYVSFDGDNAYISVPTGLVKVPLF